MSTPSPDAGPPASGLPVCYRHPGRETGIRCQRCGRPICPECMRDAAVGFQCPSCVAEGAKSTRQGIGAYGGSRSSNPALTSIVLIGMNVAVWLAVVASGGGSSRLADLLGLRADGGCPAGENRYNPLLSSEQCPSDYLPGLLDGAYWQVLSNAFLHIEIWHVAVNMLSLWVLGPQLEAALGRVRFLAVYLGSALAASTAVYWLESPGGLTLGASGAIFGLFGALAVLVHKVGADLRALGGILAVNLVITFLFPFISWQGHLGGLVGGAVITAAIVYAPKGPRRPLVQGLAGLGIVALLALAIIARSAALS